MAHQSAKPLEDVTPEDIELCWLWSFVPSKDGRLWLKPVKINKTDKFFDRLAGCKVIFADGTSCTAFIAGIDLEVPQFSKHNRELHLWIEGRGWFQLAQYFDSAELKASCGDEVLCELLGKRLDEVFPIAFDLRNRAKSDSPCLSGRFEHNPPWGITRQEVMELLVKEMS